jgi:hypothetical protein
MGINRLNCVVKNDPQRISLPGNERTKTVAEAGAVEAARAFDWTISGTDNHSFPLFEAYGMTDRLRTRLLLYQQQFASGELLVRPAQTDHNLEGKEDLAVQILVEAIEITGAIAQQ